MSLAATAAAATGDVLLSTFAAARKAVRHGDDANESDLRGKRHLWTSLLVAGDTARTNGDADGRQEVRVTVIFCRVVR